MPSKKRLQYRYSVTGQRSLLVDPDGGRFSYTYDSLKRLTRVLNPEGQRTTFGYDNASRRTVKVLANGSRTSFTYDLANRITTVAQLKSDASVQARYDYKYDRAGNRTAMAESGHTTARTTWSYDAAYQLTGEHRTGANPYRNTYAYDTRGNRTLKNLDGARTTSSYDDANQLKWTDDGSGRTTYTFDADGNQQVVLTPAGQRTTSVWDYENKLVGVLNPSGTRETMAYDPDGRRVKQQTATDTVKYVWDQENYLQETDASNVAQATYTNEPRTYGNLISQRKSSATHYYVFDALGSTRLLTDSAEAVAESLLYDAWGNLVTSAPSMAVPFRWVGELGYLFVPASGDYYVRARVYRPASGRWSSKDPLSTSLLTQRYDYSKNRTTLSIDPTGLQPMAQVPEGGGPCSNRDCEACVRNARDLDDIVKDLWDRIRTAHQVPLVPALGISVNRFPWARLPACRWNVACVEYTGMDNKLGEWDPNTNTVYLYWNNIYFFERSTADEDRCRALFETLRHELVHQIHTCLGLDATTHPDTVDAITLDCDDCICEEIDAHSIALQCEDNSVWREMYKALFTPRVINGQMLTEKEVCLLMSSFNSCDAKCPPLNRLDNEKVERALLAQANCSDALLSNSEESE